MEKKVLLAANECTKRKTHFDGSLEQYEARLIAQGFSQEYGLNYEEKFALVSKITTIRTLISMATDAGRF